MLRSVDCECAPTAADFQDPIAAIDLKLAADAVELFLLRQLQGIIGAAKIRAGINHGCIQEQPVKAVSEIIVRTDVPAAAPHRIRAKAVSDERSEGIQPCERAAM